MFLGEMQLYISLEFSFPRICHFFIVQEHMSVGDSLDDSSAEEKLKHFIV